MHPVTTHVYYALKLLLCKKEDIYIMCILLKPAICQESVYLEEHNFFDNIYSEMDKYKETNLKISYKDIVY